MNSNNNNFELIVYSLLIYCHQFLDLKAFCIDEILISAILLACFAGMAELVDALDSKSSDV